VAGNRDEASGTTSDYVVRSRFSRVDRAIARSYRLLMITMIHVFARFDSSPIRGNIVVFNTNILAQKVDPAHVGSYRYQKAAERAFV
jgi:hypothetical protein